jgi:uncharacterized phage protein gp47/JayE
MPSAADIASNMIAALQVSIPNLDTSIGTPLRHVLDSLSEQIAEAYTDGYLINYQYDIDSKVGGDLDDFCSLFGITRIPAQRATGVVTFSRPSDANTLATIVTIPPGSQEIAMTNPIVYCQTTVSAIMNVNDSTANVPVQAVVAGSQGNVPAGLLNTIASALSGITSCTNTSALTGGQDRESDTDLRTRFKQTVFRSLAGTSAMYQAIAQSVPQNPTTASTFAVKFTNIIGSSKRWQEQLQVVSGTATSTVTNAAYIFPDNVFCAVDLSSGVFLNQETDFSFAPTNPTDGISNASAVLTSLSSTTMPDGLYDLDFEYVPQASRNDPGNTRFGQGGINNRIDVWCNGSIPQSATQNVVFSTALTFSTLSTSPYYNVKYSIGKTGSQTPTAGQIFVPLSYGPILNVPLTLTIGGTVYNYLTDYFAVHRTDCFGYTMNSTFGLAWTTTSGRIPANGSIITLTYTYNQVPSLVQQSMEQWRLVGTDAKAHAGKTIPLLFNFAIVFDQRFDSTAVTTSINDALAAYLSTIGFDATLRVAGVLNVVSNVAGVLNARFLTSTDNSGQYAICRMSNWVPNTIVSIYNQGGRATDIAFADDQYPVFSATNIVTKAQNTFTIGA